MRPPSTVERWTVVKTLFWAASDAAPEERERLLAERTDDERVRAEVRRLLQASDDVGDRFERPAIDALAGALEAEGALLEVDATHLLDQHVGPYEVVRLVDEGRTSTVYEAVRTDDAFRQHVAVKTLWLGVDAEAMARRLDAERRTLVALHHPNLARLFDGGLTAAGIPYLVTEFVDGEPIDAWCDARRVSIAGRLALFRQLCDAVQYAHRHLVLHLGLTPSSVLVTGDAPADAEVKLLDLGVAALIEAEAPEQLEFAAPEQLRAGRVSTAADVYALGALLHLLLTGRAPTDGSQPPSALATDEAAHARGLPSRSRLARNLRGDLDAIALMAMRRDPEQRYPTADALGEDVRRFLVHEPVRAQPSSLGRRLHALVRRRRR